MAKKIGLGIDVSKLSFDACLLWENGKELKKKFANALGGFRELLVWLHGLDKSLLHVCLEPTGVYSRNLAGFLHQEGIMISQVNSCTVKAYGRSKNFRSKTDCIDAYLLADYCLKENPPTWVPASVAQMDLKEIQNRLESLDTEIRREKNRLETVQNIIVRADIEDNLAQLEIRKKRLEREAKTVAKNDQSMSKDFAILNSIIGLGEKSSLMLLAKIQFRKFEDARQVGAFAGVTPRKFESGTSIQKRPRISRIGSTELRSALYFPAIVAMQHNPQLREFAQRLKAKNKPSKVIICAIIRKLLVLAATLIHNQQMYDANYCSSLASNT